MKPISYKAITFKVTPKASALYRKLEEEVKGLGVKLIHKDRKCGGGTFSTHNRSIVVPNKTRNTAYGCFYLAHELGHAKDYREGKFKKWFQDEFGENEWVSENYIRELEGSPNKFAKRILEKNGIPTKNILGLQPRCFEEWNIPYTVLFCNGFDRDEIPKLIDELYKEIDVVPFWKEKEYLEEFEKLHKI